MAQLTVTQLKGKSTDWYPSFKKVIILTPTEVANIDEHTKYLLRDGKILKNGTCKVSRTAMFMEDGADVGTIFKSEAELLNYLGVAVDGHNGVVNTTAPAPKVQRPVTSLL
jgi:hypothetical protein